MEALGIGELLPALRTGGGVGVAAWALIWLLRRGDVMQRSNLEELRRQRDEWRDRAEAAEAELAALRDEVSTLRAEVRGIQGEDDDPST